MTTPIRIAGRPVGPGHAPYVIAELSGNHNRSLERALAIVDAAAEAGADACKLQTYRGDTITLDHDGPEFTIQGGLWDGRKLFELYEEAHTPWEWHEALFRRGRERGITVFSSPFDPTAVDLLESLGAPAYKIASPELVDLPLIRLVAATGKPVIMSTGMGTPDEIEEAVAAAREGGCRELVLLHCVSAYPAPVEASNLRTLGDLATRFGLPVGLSDHTMGTTVAVAAVALGACVVEKHFTLARADGGVDSAFSLEPAELRALVRDTRAAALALGEIDYRGDAEQATVQFRRSLYVVRDVPRGATLTAADVRSIRPSNGMHTRWYDAVLGRAATRDLKRGEPLAFDMVEGLEPPENDSR